MGQFKSVGYNSGLFVILEICSFEKVARSKTSGPMLWRVNVIGETSLETIEGT